MRTRKEEGRGKKEEGFSPLSRGFRKLIAWQQAMELASCTFSAVRTKRLPPWLEGQVMSAALSVPSNIAEGYTRAGLKDYLRFLDFARSSLAELESHLYFMVTNGVLEQRAYDELDRRVSGVGNILVALMRSLNRKLKDGSWNRISEEPTEYLFTVEEDSHLPPSSFHLPGGEG